MPSSKPSYDLPWSLPCPVVREEQIGITIVVDMLLTGFGSKYLNILKVGEGLREAAIREGYTRFKREKDSAELASIAARHQLASAALQASVGAILQRMVFDIEALTDPMAPPELGWKTRDQAKLGSMKVRVPLLQKRAQGREISGLSAYEQ